VKKRAIHGRCILSIGCERLSMIDTRMCGKRYRRLRS
jgi:hypothetical protein